METKRGKNYSGDGGKVTKGARGGETEKSEPRERSGMNIEARKGGTKKAENYRGEKRRRMNS